MKSCSDKVKETFPGGVYRNPPTLFERLEEIGIRLPPEDRHYPFFACFDFEAFFLKKTCLLVFQNYLMKSATFRCP